ncbi:hypothetical protein [Psychroserpens luteus]|uniref:Uncharacterized protein n=1 Tax=Psychroserpens luteus TaxID=1434066 RepID=A0ABW5ZXQ7_9FLAO|nr:hypothetical protein [Psychroserpens luteus]
MTNKSFRKVLLFFAAIVFGAGLYLLLKILTFSLFDNKPLSIEIIKIPNKNYDIEICYFPSNATVQPSIQIRKITNDSVKVISDYNRYNFLKEYQIKNDSLFITLSDTMRKNVKEKKTGIKLPNE